MWGGGGGHDTLAVVVLWGLRWWLRLGPCQGQERGAGPIPHLLPRPANQLQGAYALAQPQGSSKAGDAQGGLRDKQEWGVTPHGRSVLHSVHLVRMLHM